MQNDEQEIRNLVQRWLDASQAGDTPTILNLMTDEVMFMLPGREPFGKEAFQAAAMQQQKPQIEGQSDIQEIKVLGDWAWMRNKLRVTITPPGSPAVTHSGYVLTILRRKPDGRWAIHRDANLLMPEKAKSE